MSGASHHTPEMPSFDKPVKLLIVVAPYYKDIADDLVAGAKAQIEAVGGTWELVEVPGALEVPTAIRIAQRTSNFDGFVALGCVIRGETTHYDTVCNDNGGCWKPHFTRPLLRNIDTLLVLYMTRRTTTKSRCGTPAA